MIFNWFRFGRLLSQGTAQYEQGEYLLAKEATEKALEIDNEDFTAIFLLLRLAVILNKVDCAEECIARCQSNNPYATGILVPHWQDALAAVKRGEAITQFVLKKMNQESRENLEKLQDERTVGIVDLIFVIAFMFLLVAILASIMLMTSGKIGAGIAGGITTIFLLWYYNVKSKLHINLYLRLSKLMVNTAKLFRSVSFLSYLAIILILQLSFNHTKIEMDSFQEGFGLFALIILFPIYAQIRNCGFIYLSVKKYGKIPAYLLVGIVGGFSGYATGNFLQYCISAIFYLSAFEKFHTMAAPVLLEIFYNSCWALLGFL